MTTPNGNSTITIRPGGWSVVLLARRPLTLAVAILLLCIAGLWSPSISGYAQFGMLIAIAITLLALVIGALDRDARVYQLSDLHATVRSGFVRRDAGALRLADIRAVTTHRSLAERLLGLETIVLSTAGGTLVWRHVRSAEQLSVQLQSRIAAIRDSAPTMDAPAAATPNSPRATAHQQSTDMPTASKRIPVIGLAGGIGAGKSAVAAAFAKLGCLVIDSDARAKAALDRPDVRDQLVRWWGGKDGNAILTDHRIDRAKVAAIIFANPDDRRKLEELVHPIVRQERAAIIADAVQSGARAAIVDAPLLFEAGVDRECDVVVFVDAPRSVRLDRVAKTRGWSEAELHRRETAQLPLEEKRSRSHYVVSNDTTPDAVLPQIEHILSQILSASPSPSPAHPPARGTWGGTGVGDNSPPP
ncbi:MAG: dephospho-CoA kinase [Phycisphaerales bacterium]|nr:dephospho-CoA kinase [Phycisphaerales bacterium]